MILTILVIAISLYLGLTLILFLMQARLIYFPTARIEATPADIGLRYETVQLETVDRIKLSGWFVPADQAAGVILFFHGNAGNISHRLESIARFHRLGLDVFIIDYRGYGQSEGTPTEQGTYLDGLAAWHYLVNDRQFPPEQVIIFGRSLGGAVGAWLAQQHKPGAIILESTFTSVPDLAAKHYPILPVRRLARIHYDTLSRIPAIACPILVVHSPGDEIIPYEHGQQLFAAAQEPKAFLELRGGHNEGFIISGETYEQGLAAFINRHLAPGRKN